MEAPSVQDYPVFEVGYLGQQAVLSQLYTQITLCYPLPSESSSSELSDADDAIISKLEAGLSVLAASFKWVAGQSILEASPSGSTYKIHPYREAPELVVRNHRDNDSVPSYEEMKKANFPMNTVDENVIAPRPTLPFGTEKVFPVFIVQANFIRGGLLLTVNGLHSCLDMVGQGRLMYLLHKVCTDPDYIVSHAKEDIETGNSDWTKVFPLIENYKPGPELERQIATPPPEITVTPEGVAAADVQQPVCQWVYYSFSAEASGNLKKEASNSLPEGAGFVSTDDAISAFIWKCVSRARLPRLFHSGTDKTDVETVFARALDARRFLGVSDTFPGLLQNQAYNAFPLSKISSLPLGVIAASLRSVLAASIKPENKNTKHDIGYRTRAMATALHTSPPDLKKLISVTATIDVGKDIMLSSWCKEKCYECDFGLGLGKPDFVRRPKFLPVESLIYLLPKKDDGETAVAMCLRQEDLERLRADQEWSKYATYIG